MFAFTFIIVLFVLLLYLSPATLKNRFTVESVIFSNGTGRFDLWQQGIDFFADSSFIRKLLGQGTNTITKILLVEEHGSLHGYVMHNIFLETLVELGIIGFLIYLLMIGSFAVKAFKQKDKFAFAVIMGMIFLSFSTSLHTFKPYFNIMLYIVIFGNVKQNIINNDVVKL